MMPHLITVRKHLLHHLVSRMNRPPLPLFLTLPTVTLTGLLTLIIMMLIKLSQLSTLLSSPPHLDLMLQISTPARALPTP